MPQAAPHGVQDRAGGGGGGGGGGGVSQLPVLSSRCLAATCCGGVLHTVRLTGVRQRRDGKQEVLVTVQIMSASTPPPPPATAVAAAATTTTTMQLPSLQRTPGHVGHCQERLIVELAEEDVSMSELFFSGGGGGGGGGDCTATAMGQPRTAPTATAASASSANDCCSVALEVLASVIDSRTGLREPFAVMRCSALSDGSEKLGDERLSLVRVDAASARVVVEGAFSACAFQEAGAAVVEVTVTDGPTLCVLSRTSNGLIVETLTERKLRRRVRAASPVPRQWVRSVQDFSRDAQVLQWGACTSTLIVWDVGDGDKFPGTLPTARTGTGTSSSPSETSVRRRWHWTSMAQSSLVGAHRDCVTLLQTALPGSSTAARTAVACTLIVENAVASQTTAPSTASALSFSSFVPPQFGASARHEDLAVVAATSLRCFDHRQPGVGVSVDLFLLLTNRGRKHASGKGETDVVLRCRGGIVLAIFSLQPAMDVTPQPSVRAAVAFACHPLPDGRPQWSGVDDGIGILSVARPGSPDVQGSWTVEFLGISKVCRLERTSIQGLADSESGRPLVVPWRSPSRRKSSGLSMQGGPRQSAPHCLVLCAEDVVDEAFAQLLVFHMDDHGVATVAVVAGACLRFQQRWKLEGPGETLPSPQASAARSNRSSDQAQRRPSKRKATPVASSATVRSGTTTTSNGKDSSVAGALRKLELAEKSLFARLKIGYEQLQARTAQVDRKRHLFSDGLRILSQVEPLRPAGTVQLQPQHEAVRATSVPASVSDTSISPVDCDKADESIRTVLLKKHHVNLTRHQALGELSTLVPALQPRAPEMDRPLSDQDYGSTSLWQGVSQAVQIRSVEHHVLSTCCGACAAEVQLHVQLDLNVRCSEPSNITTPTLPLALQASQFSSTDSGETTAHSESSLKPSPLLMEGAVVMISTMAPGVTITQHDSYFHFLPNQTKHGPLVPVCGGRSGAEKLVLRLAATATVRFFSQRPDEFSVSPSVIIRTTTGTSPANERRQCPQAFTISAHPLQLSLPAKSVGVDGRVPIEIVDSPLPSGAPCLACDQHGMSAREDICLTIDRESGSGTSALDLRCLPWAINTSEIEVFSHISPRARERGGVVLSRLSSREAECVVLGGRNSVTGQVGSALRTLRRQLPASVSLRLNPLTDDRLWALENAMKTLFKECTCLLDGRSSESSKGRVLPSKNSDAKTATNADLFRLQESSDNAIIDLLKH